MRWIQDCHYHHQQQYSNRPDSLQRCVCSPRWIYLHRVIHCVLHWNTTSLQMLHQGSQSHMDPGSAPPQKIRLRTTVHWTPHKRYLSLFSNKRVTPVLYNILVIDNINWLIIGKVWAVSTPPYCFGGMGLNSENHDFDCDITGQSAVTWPVI